MATASQAGSEDSETLKRCYRKYEEASIEEKSVVVLKPGELGCSASCGRDLCWHC